ncbi:MAG TPA: DUF433 domain-containing protein [Longimicrobium sp.]|nr:DUF433 domain-containing protein [Longimicrobium sp.]
MIVRDAETGEAMIAGTDITVARVLRQLESAGRESVLAAFPELTEEAVFAAVSFALSATRREVRYDASGGARPGVVREAAFAYGRRRTVTLDAEEYQGLLDRVGFLSGLRVPVGAGAVEAAVGQSPRTLAEDLEHADDVYGRLRYETAVVGTLRDGLRAIEEGDVYDHEEVMAELRAILFA